MLRNTFLLQLFGVAISDDCFVCKQVVSGTVSVFSTGDPYESILIKGTTDNCFLGVRDTQIEQKTCGGKCYSMFYATKGTNANDEKVETLVAERGCVYEKNGVDFPASECLTEPCTLALTEDNYGNGGTIDAYYYIGDDNIDSKVKYTDSTKGLKCAQCESSMEDDSCYNSPPTGNCANLNATTCYSTVSHYVVTDDDGTDQEYKFAMRGCSETTSAYAEYAGILSTIGPVHIDPLDSESELVMRTMETTYCTGNNCNKDKMAEISYSGANINHSVTALVIMACMALLR